MPKYAALIYSPAEEEGVEVSPEVRETVIAEYYAFGEAAGDTIVAGEALLGIPDSLKDIICRRSSSGTPWAAENVAVEIEKPW